MSLHLNLEEGVDINEENNNGQTALHIAVINNDLEMVKFLLSRGADVNRKTSTIDKETSNVECECEYSKYCYHIADEYGNEIKDTYIVGQNALHLAAKNSCVDIVKLLLNTIENVNSTADDNSTALHLATQNCLTDDTNICISEVLLKSGAEINPRNNEGKTPLYLAVKFEKLKLVKYLISMGADVNIFTRYLSTPLYSALINCNIELVQLLLDHKASVTVRNKYDEDPLFFILRVVNKGETLLRLIKLLLNYGLNATVRNNHGSTAIHIAVQNKDEDLAKLIIENGCPIDSKNNFNMSPLFIAVCTNLHNLAKLLLDHGANANDFVNNSSILEHAIIRRNEAMVQLLLEYNADPNIGSERNKPVAAACLHKNTRIMQMLIDKGADINYKDKRGRTPLMKVIKEPNYKMIKILLEHGACVNQKDYHGNTAFHLLFENGPHTKEVIIKYLLEQGADVNIENDDGYTPFRYMMFKCFTKGEVLIFVKHIALLLAQDMHVNPKIMKYIRCNNLWDNCLNSCQKELNRMKEVTILERYTYFDILTKRYNTLSTLFDMKSALDFRIDILQNNFMNYSDILMKNFIKKSERFKLIKKSYDVLSEVFKSKIPPEVVEKVCEYLSNCDLRMYLSHEIVLSYDNIYAQMLIT